MLSAVGYVSTRRIPNHPESAASELIKTLQWEEPGKRDNLIFIVTMLREIIISLYSACKFSGTHECGCSGVQKDRKGGDPENLLKLYFIGGHPVCKINILKDI